MLKVNSYELNSHNSYNGASWYAVSTRSRHEKTAANLLERIDIPTFLPLVNERRRWSDRNQTVSVPLFSCYVFVHLPAVPELYVRVLKTPGVVSFVGNRGTPLPIEPKEIEGVRAVLSQQVACTPYPFLKIGQRVRIVGGALDQIEGILVGRGPESKLVISVELIQRSIAISVYDFDIEPIEARDSSAA